MPFLKIYVLRVIVAAIIVLIGYCIRDLGLFLNLVGSAAGLLLGFIFPIVFYWKSMDYKIPKVQWIFDSIVIAAGSLGGLYAFYTSIMGFTARV